MKKEEYLILKDVDATIIRGLAENDMNITKTAVALYMHRNTVIYHVHQIKKISGLNPVNFFDLIELCKFIGILQPCDDEKELPQKMKIHAI